MKDETKDKIEKPAYATYRTFTNFTSTLQEHGIPDQIDRSVMSKMSGSAQAMILSSLRFLKLIDENDMPTEKLRTFVTLEGEEKQDVFKVILNESYWFLNDGSFNISTGTIKQLEQIFRDAGIGGSTIDKAIAFFLAAAKDAGFELSRFLTHSRPARTKNISQSKKKSKKKLVQKEKSEQHLEEGIKPPEGTIKFDVPLIGRPSASIVLPKDLSESEWEMLKGMFDLYAKNLIQSTA